MRYAAYKEAKGTWFINTHKVGGQQYGKRYDTEQEAKQEAALKSMYYYQTMMDNAWAELIKISDTNSANEVRLVGTDHYAGQHDFLC